MASHIVGYPRMGPKRELKFALESFWDGKSSAEDLQKVGTDVRNSIWKQMSDVGIKYIPSNTFSYYDQMLDTTAMLGAVPERYSWTGGEIGFETYFSMARGNASSVPAMEMTKWFDTYYHFIVPELGPNTKFSYASHKAVTEYKEAKALGIDTIPVLIGPVTYLLLSKAAKGVEKSFPLLSLLESILPVYREVIAELKAAGATWIQFDEPTLVKDLESQQLAAFTKAYAELESTLSGLNVVVETYFADIPAEAYKTLTSLSGVTGFGFDLIHGTTTLELVKSIGFPAGKYFFAGVVDGRNIWANDLSESLTVLQNLERIVGKDKLVVSTSCSLMHTAVDLINETKLDDEIKSWLGFAAQKVVEVNALAKALVGQKDEAFFSANAAALASRKSSPRVTNEKVQKAAVALRGSDHRRATTVSARLVAQQENLCLPLLPTTTIGSFPVTNDLRRVRKEHMAKIISEETYTREILSEIYKVVKLQERLGIDVLVHGEPERHDVVEYFGDRLIGFACTANGWVQSYGSRCVRPPIIYGDVSRPCCMTDICWRYAQGNTSCPVKGMLAGPVTMLNRSFVRNDQPRFETCYQIALAIKKEVEDLESYGAKIIQIDEVALVEGLPLREAEHTSYLDWAVHSFRITNCGVKDITQIHTHMGCSNFNDIIHSIINMDADVITFENSRSDEKLLSVFHEGVTYGAGIGPGVYDIHSPRIPSTEEIASRVDKMVSVLNTNSLWVNPDCGLKNRTYEEIEPVLRNMVLAAKHVRESWELRVDEISSFLVSGIYDLKVGVSSIDYLSIDFACSAMEFLIILNRKSVDWFNNSVGLFQNEEAAKQVLYELKEAVGMYDSFLEAATFFVDQVEKSKMLPTDGQMDTQAAVSFLSRGADIEKMNGKCLERLGLVRGGALIIECENFNSNRQIIKAIRACNWLLLSMIGNVFICSPREFACVKEHHVDCGCRAAPRKVMCLIANLIYDIDLEVQRRGGFKQTIVLTEFRRLMKIAEAIRVKRGLQIGSKALSNWIKKFRDGMCVFSARIGGLLKEVEDASV